MKKVREILLGKGSIEKNTWWSFIKSVSHFNGYFKPWKIIVTEERNKIRFYSVTDCALPPTIDGCNDFMLKKTPLEKIGQSKKTKYCYTNASSLIDLINHFEIRGLADFKRLELTIFPISKERTYCKKVAYSIENNKLIKNVLISVNSIELLCADFSGNKRYLYSGILKYLDMSKALPILSEDSENAVFKVNALPYSQKSYFLKLNDFDFDKHSLILGSSGTGKSKLLSLLIDRIYNSDLIDKYKVVVIDPHNALKDEIGIIAKIIDFKDEKKSIDLFKSAAKDIIPMCEILLDLFKSVMNERYNSKVERVLRHSTYLLLMNNSFDFNNLKLLLTEAEYRNELVNKLSNSLPAGTITFFLSEFNEIRTKSYTESISPIIAFIDEMELVPCLSNNFANSLESEIENNFLTIFSLDNTYLGNNITKTIAGLVMGQLFTLIQSKKIEKHIIFVVDEVAIIENPILRRFLSEARKYNLSIVLAGQYFEQISPSLKEAIFANVVNEYIFRLSTLDANTIGNSIDMKIPLATSNDQKIKMLSELNDRECIVRICKNGLILPAFKATTLNYESKPAKPQNEISTKTYSREKEMFELEKFELDTQINAQEVLHLTSSKRKDVIR